jgi:hypothetical protein
MSKAVAQLPPSEEAWLAATHSRAASVISEPVKV